MVKPSRSIRTLEKIFINEAITAKKIQILFCNKEDEFKHSSYQKETALSLRDPLHPRAMSDLLLFGCEVSCSPTANKS